MKKILSLLGVTFSLFLTSCTDDEYPGDKTLPSGGTYDRTVILYMVAESSLDQFYSKNFDQIAQGLSAMTPGRNTVVAYVDPITAYPKFGIGTTPCIMEMKLNPDRSITSNIIKEYEERSSVDPNFMQEVLNEIIELYPSESYGLVFWGHGSGWNSGSGFNNEPTAPPASAPKRAYGGENEVAWMELGDLADRLPGDTFDFIIFDVCYMGGVEVLYQLRDKADYIISSPTEVMGDGYPYHEIIPLFYYSDLDLVDVCRRFYKFYDDRDSNPYATVSLVETSELPALASVVKEIITSNPEAVMNINTNNLQTFGRGTYAQYYFDLGDFMKRIASASQYDDFLTRMGRTVIYKANTSSFMGLRIDDEKFSGLSSYVYKGKRTVQNDHYTTLDWYGAVYE